MGFDVDFPAIRQAAERMRSADFECRTFGAEVGDALDSGSGAAGGGALAGAMGELSSTVRKSADATADVVKELWQAVDASEEQYYGSDVAAARDFRDVRFADRDGFG